MPVINSVRLININYNHNSIRVNDEIMDFNGKSTLISLRNGGGKSVLVQMLTAPFVHKKYRNAKDRPFEEYFTGAKPSFILVEWKLDGGAGYLMNGLMVRRSQGEISEGDSCLLDILSVISCYKEPCICDIHHLPVVEKNKKEMLLKNFGSCRQMFEDYKKDPSLQFFYYDMNMQAQSRQYFQKLGEYKINYKEWEKIIVKLNLEESGLSNLFADCRDERGLTEKWFLETVEGKLNGENNRISQFQKIIDKYIRQYSENSSKIKRRTVIDQFKSFVCEDSKDQERRSILSIATEADQRMKEKELTEQRIAAFLHELELLKERIQKEIHLKQAEIDQISEEKSELEYEKYSFLIHEEQMKKKLLDKELSLLQLELSDVEKRKEDLERRIHILECALAEKKRLEEYREYQEIAKQLETLKMEDQDKEPRRKELGTMLYRYYDLMKHQYMLTIEESKKKKADLSDQLKKYESELAEMERRKEQLIAGIASLQERINAYQETEDSFNKQYSGGCYPVRLDRNITGCYESGYLDIAVEECEQKIKKEMADLQKNKKMLGEKKLEYEHLVADKNALIEQRTKKEQAMERHQEIKKELEAEIEYRKSVLNYLGMAEEFLYQRSMLMDGLDKKIDEKNAISRQLDLELHKLQKEILALKSGKILEIPQELKELLEKKEIIPVIGMEWLRKNQKTEKDNLEIVKNNPFLPYSVILTMREFEKLKTIEDHELTSTSFPLPIVIREELEREDLPDMMENGRVYSFSRIHFYVKFNENLLNEQKLKQMLSEKEAFRKRTEEKRRECEEQLEEYRRKRDRIEHQKLTLEIYKRIQSDIKNDRKELDDIFSRIDENQSNQEMTQKSLKELEIKIRQEENNTAYLQNEKTDLLYVREKYETYCGQLEELCGAKKEQEKNRTNIELRKNIIKDCENKNSELDRQMKDTEEKTGDCENKLGQYRFYLDDTQPVSEKKLTEEELISAEMEYKSLSTAFRDNIVQQEERLKKQDSRLQQAVRDLDKLRKRYAVTEEDYSDIVYHEQEEEEIRGKLKEADEKCRIKTREISEKDKESARAQDQIDYKIEEMKRITGKESSLPEEMLRKKDFDAEIAALVHKQKGAEKEKTLLVIRSGYFDTTKSSLTDYEELELHSDIHFDQDFYEMDEEELHEYRNQLISEYRHIQNDMKVHKDDMEQRLNELIKMEAFKEDYFRKPLEALLRLTGQPSDVIRQIRLTVQAYDELLEKISIDISVIEKEHDSITGQLLDYVKEIHENLGKIDANSTIRVVDEKQEEHILKMLKIDLPFWQEHEEIYKNRLYEFIDLLTKEGIALHKKNESIEAFLGVKVNTRNLYDTVVGTGNVQVKLYKIEQFRQYPISWSEVARNSGGEGFLSSFVVLSSLLYYMRRDEHDIFADHKEGKVLLMDNPFAATSSEHLLKPLMSLAYKNQTQIIALSGLGGDSIYGRFDNIYVLNIVSGGLNRNIQYLKSEHLRGNEPDTILSSHLEVTEPEQLSLF